MVQLDKFKLTKKVLWDEYRQAYPDGYGYTQFCHHLNQYLKTRRPTMVLTHHPAEKLFVDFAGRKLSYVNFQTGEVIPCNVFVACLPDSIPKIVYEMSFIFIQMYSFFCSITGDEAKA